MALATCVDPVLHNLDLLENILGAQLRYLGAGGESFSALKLKLKYLRTFLICATKWGNKYNDPYLEPNHDDKKVSLHSLLSNIEDEVKKNGVQIHSLSLRKETELDYSALKPVVSDFHASIKSFKQEIIKAYIALSAVCSSSSQSSSSCVMRDDELVHFTDLLVQILMDLLRRPLFPWTLRKFNRELYAQIEALEDKLTFLKSLVCFAKLQGVQIGQLEHLHIHIEVVALHSARLTCLCSFYHEDEEVCSPTMCFLISELVQIIKVVDGQIIETYISVLKASKSSPSTHAVWMDKQIISNFNDSLISCLWELLLCHNSFAGAVKDQMKLLYEGLRFLRTILREPLKTDKLNEDIRAVIAEAGVIIFSLSRHQLPNGSDIDSLELTSVLVDTNRDIKLIGAQNINSEALVTLPSDDNIKQQVQSKLSTLTKSKAKTPRIHEVVVDLHDEVHTVKERLMSGSNQLEIIPIVGMPGLGKTTLAKSVYNDTSIKYHFHISRWCCVSQSYNKCNVLLQILGNDGKYSNTNVQPEQMDVNDLLLELYQRLKKNRYLVVIDDVWDIDVWNDLKTTFPNDHNGSRILITSRFSNVASQVEKSHSLRQLTDTESWELLQKKVFGKENCPEALQRPGMEIAKICKGLPLTVVIIAGILATAEHDVWVEFAKSLTSTIVYETDQHCEKTLELSYAHLPTHLKPCLLYFGAFPKDRKIRTRKLAWLWMAEGLVQPTESKRMEDVAEEYLMDLIGRNLVMVTEQRSMGEAKTCCIHDLIHEFCKAKAKEENFLQFLQGHDELSVFIEPPNLERLSISSTPEEFNKSRLFCPNAHSLLFFRHHINEFQFESIADISYIFCLYQHLRVLKIEEIVLAYKDCPCEIAFLVQLRYLAVRVDYMESVPPSIANLTNLETLIFSCYYYDLLLTDTIWNLKKLRHLHIKGRLGVCLLLTENSENTSSLDNLVTFTGLSVPVEHLEDTVKKIPNVRRLRINLIVKTSEGCNAALVMDSLSRLERLESLEVSISWRLSSLKGHIEYRFASTLRELSLRDLHNPWSKISVIEDLPNLEVLKLLQYSFVGERWEMKAGGFPKLRFLKLSNVKLGEWTDDDAHDSDHYFPCLEKLVLEGKILKFGKVPSCLYCSPTLKMIQVQLCMNETVRSLVCEIEKEQKEYGNENLKILMD